MDKPSELGGTEQMIAMMYTASEMNPSLFGDNHLYFRHQLIDDDLQFRPEWEPYVPAYGGLFECPFKTIIELLK